MQNTPGHSEYGEMFVFRLRVLLGSVCPGEFLMDPMCLAVVGELGILVLVTIVRMEMT